jgi:hypothetical protein
VSGLANRASDRLRFQRRRWLDRLDSSGQRHRDLAEIDELGLTLRARRQVRLEGAPISRTERIQSVGGEIRFEGVV